MTDSTRQKIDPKTKAADAYRIQRNKHDSLVKRRAALIEEANGLTAQIESARKLADYLGSNPLLAEAEPARLDGEPAVPDEAPVPDQS